MFIEIQRIKILIISILLFITNSMVVAALPLQAEGEKLPSLAPMLDKVTPAVVNIATEGRIQLRQNPLFADPFFRRFFNIPDQPIERRTQSLGSGVIVDAKRGLVLTNNHVIANAVQITVTLRDGRQLDAEIIGTDPETDVAVIKIPVENLTDIKLSDATGLTVGNGAALEIIGIPNLNFAAARISAIVSNTVTLEYDSTGFTGTFTSGDFIELDRITIYGAWNFLIYYIKNMSVIYGDGDVKIILSGAPSSYTAFSSFDSFVGRIAGFIRNISDKWDLSFFDIGFLLVYNKWINDIYCLSTL